MLIVFLMAITYQSLVSLGLRLPLALVLGIGGTSRLGALFILFSCRMCFPKSNDHVDITHNPTRSVAINAVLRFSWRSP
jgi:hypothetical protein